MDPEVLGAIAASKLLPTSQTLLLLAAQAAQELPSDDNDDDEEEEESYHKNYERHSLKRLTGKEIKEQFRFNRNDIPRLCDLLGMKGEYVSPTRLRWGAEEGLCILLRRLAYPNRLADIVQRFGRSKSELSIIANSVQDWVIEHHLHRLQSLSQPWLDHEQFAAAVLARGAACDNVFAFIDGTLKHTCRPRKNQKEVYSGHKRHHGLKYQAVQCPNGLVCHAYGPSLGKVHDSTMYRESGLDDLLQQVQGNNGRQLAIFGDAAYALRPYLYTPYKGAVLTPAKQEFNNAMQPVRLCVEWSFDKLTKNFAFTNYYSNQKIFLQQLAKQYLAATLFTNCHTCLYGSQTSTFFDLAPPTLEQYLGPY